MRNNNIVRNGFENNRREEGRIRAGNSPKGTGSWKMQCLKQSLVALQSEAMPEKRRLTSIKIERNDPNGDQVRRVF